MSRQDEDTDNDPAGTDGDDSIKQYEDQLPQGPSKNDKAGSRNNQPQLHPKELLTEGDCDMNDDGDTPENKKNPKSSNK